MKKIAIALSIAICLISVIIGVVHIRNQQQMRRHHIDTIHLQLGRIYNNFQRAMQTDPEDEVGRVWDYLRYVEESTRLKIAMDSLSQMDSTRRLSLGGASNWWMVRPQMQYIFLMAQRDIGYEVSNYARILRELLQYLSLGSSEDFTPGLNLQDCHFAPINPDYSISSEELFSAINRASRYISGQARHSFRGF